MPKFISISCVPLPTFVQGGYAIFDEGEKHPDRDNLQYFVLFTIVKGSLYIAEDGTNYTLKPGDTFLLLPQHHHYSWKKIDQRTEYYWIHFSVLGSWTEDEQPHQMAPNIAIPKQHYFTPAVTLVIKKWQQVDTAPLIPLIDRLLKYSSEQNSVGFWQSQQLFIDIIQFVQYALPSVSSTEQLGNRVKSYLINHFGEPVTNQVLQERFHLHPNSITRKFEAEFYMTLKQYLNNYRLMEGARRLRTTGQSVARIAEEVGYQNAYYFSKQFKKKFNCSPSEYRQQTPQ